MIEFVDLKDGRVFNGDAPYVFWFDGGQSVNLNYVRKICFISTNRVVKAHIESETFSLLKLNQSIPRINDPDLPEGKAEYINEKLYLGLEYLQSTDYISQGWQYNDFFVHMVYVLAQSQEVGEIHDTLYLTDRDGTHEYEIAADFYADNEILKMNLENFDISIPESIQKAIYDVDVHEESNDNIVLNRKYKELLMNYWDIIANKGSYNSLQNSLAWFEWGDLVRIEELWKRHHEGIEEYFQTELNHELNYEFIRQFLNNSKTTYIGLYMALSKIQVKDGKLRYQGYEGNPVDKYIVSRDPDHPEIQPVARIGEEDNPYLAPVVTKWQLLDLCLKMTLLGNFYATYFVPIHVEVIHSTLEHWVMGYSIKVLHTAGLDNWTTISNVRSFGLKHEKKVKMMEHICRNYSDTLFLSNGDVFGYEDNLRDESNEAFRMTGELFKYHMGGTYGVVDFEVSEDNPILATDENDLLIRQALQWRNSDGSAGTVESYAPVKPVYLEREGYRKSQWVFLPNFSLGFMNPGHYTLTVEFDTLSGNVWSKTEEVDIEDNTRNHIDFFKVVKRDDIDRLEFDPEIWKDEEVWFKSFQVESAVDARDERYPAGAWDEPAYTPYREHCIFLEPFMGADADLNHTVLFNAYPGSLIRVNDEDMEVENLVDRFPQYIWIINKADPSDDPVLPYIRVIGIHREFGLDPQNPIKKVENVDGEPDEFVSSFRFHPFTHRLIPFQNSMKEDDYTINPTDLIYMVPQLGHSRNIDVRSWTFENATTGEVFESYLTKKNYHPDGHEWGDFGDMEEFGGMQGWFLASQIEPGVWVPVALKGGYYNIRLNYLKGDEPQVYEVKSAFKMKKTNQ